MLWLALGFVLGVVAGRFVFYRSAYYVGKRRPASELRPEQIEKIREAYRETGWASDYSVEATGIYLNRKAARRAAAIPGGFYHKLPINDSLPDKPVRHEEHDFPNSRQPELYQNAQRFVAVDRSEAHRRLGAMRLELSAVSSILRERD